MTSKEESDRLTAEMKAAHKARWEKIEAEQNRGPGRGATLLGLWVSLPMGAYLLFGTFALGVALVLALLITLLMMGKS
jgi:hypothetical protein